MYKIYINETPLILAKLQSIESLPAPKENGMVARYTGLAKTLLNYADMLEKSQRFEWVYLYTDDLDQLWTDFQSIYKVIEAAGGVVHNESNEILCIFRRGSWDLPKGKIDKGESVEAAAVREVEEETGVQDLQLGKQLQSTYHTYRLKSGKRVLKRTYWFVMNTHTQILIPQTEEDIEKAIWLSAKKFLKDSYPMYNTIREVVKESLA